jgi:SPP1 family predicted phage head-tail adaptor
MNSGAFRHKCRIEVKSAHTAHGTRGEPTFTWQIFCECWCEVRALTSREQFNLLQRWADINAMIHTHFVASVTSEMRIIDTCCSRTFDIRAADDPDGKRRQLRLTCKEIV